MLPTQKVRHLMHSYNHNEEVDKRVAMEIHVVVEIQVVVDKRVEVDMRVDNNGEDGNVHMDNNILYCHHIHNYLCNDDNNYLHHNNYLQHYNHNNYVHHLQPHMKNQILLESQCQPHSEQGIFHSF